MSDALLLLPDFALIVCGYLICHHTALGRPVWEAAERLVYDFLVAEHVLLVPGTGFNWPTHDHLRIVTLPEARIITEAIERLGNFLSSYRQQ